MADLGSRICVDGMFALLFRSSSSLNENNPEYKCPASAIFGLLHHALMSLDRSAHASYVRTLDLSYQLLKRISCLPDNVMS